MRRETFVLPMIVTMTALPSPAAAQSRALRPVRLLVSNLADVPQPFLSRAEREVVRLYSRIGVTLIWIEQGLRSGTGDLAFSREWISCRITILQDDARRLPDSQAMGAAPLSRDEPRIASVYYLLVQRAARRHAVETAVVLGHAMAHEVAHLLIPEYGHALEGLMKAVWDGRELMSAAQGQLRFSQQQATLIQAALAP